jgi:hypothetical protein
MRWASALANWRAVRDDSDASVAVVQQLNLNALVTSRRPQRPRRLVDAYPVRQLTA